MMITIKVKQSDVFAAVAQKTAYTGAKMDGDANAYERISTVDEDSDELKQFWGECRSEVVQAFSRLLSSEGFEDDADTYAVSLDVSNLFDDKLVPSMEASLFAYFVNTIASKWYVYTNKQEAGATAAIGKSLLEDLRQKAFTKGRPSRPTY